MKIKIEDPRFSTHFLEKFSRLPERSKECIRGLLKSVTSAQHEVIPVYDVGNLRGLCRLSGCQFIIYLSVKKKKTKISCLFIDLNPEVG